MLYPAFAPMEGIAMRRKIGLWIAFVLILLVVSFSATPYSKVADLTMISLRFSMVILVSILVLRERWRYRHDPDAAAHAEGALLRRMRRWYYGE